MVKSDYREADLEPEVRALVDFAVMLTRRPTDSTESDIRRLSSLGWSDEAILQAVQIIGLFNYYTRLVEALGCDPEDFMSPASDSAGRSNT